MISPSILRRALLPVGLCLVLGACTHGRYADGPYIPARGYAQDVRSAVILEARRINIGGSDGAVGAQTGAFAGAVIGSNVGGDRYRGNPFGALAGAVFGGLLGAAIEKSVTTVPAVEYVLEIEGDGSVIRLIQEGVDPVAPEGARVSLIYADRVYVDYP